jgi:Lambda phage tail tube protein, TTP
MSLAFAPRGTQLLRSPDGSAYTKYAEVVKIDNTGMKADLADVTNMDSASSFKEYLPTLIDAGDVKFDANFINTDAIQNDLMGDFSNQTLLYWRIQFPNTRGKMEWQGYITQVDTSIELPKAVTRAVTIKVTGPLVWTPNV